MSGERLSPNDAIRQALAEEAFIQPKITDETIITVQTADGELKEMTWKEYSQPTEADE
jgi:hypothetical protein